MTESNLPNFLIVGAAKSGTSSLFRYLIQHPEIFIPQKKECRFFSEMSDLVEGERGIEEWDDSIPANIEDYQALFMPAGRKKAIGDASPDYLYFYKRSIENIKKYIDGNVKIIVILRNPVERTYSHYLHYVRAGREKFPFEDALDHEESRIKAGWEFGWHYKNVSYYYRQTKAYLDNFRRVKVYFYENLAEEPQRLIKNLFEFLEVDGSFVPKIGTKFNVSGVPRNKLLDRLIMKPNPLKRAFKPILTPVLSENRIIEIKERLAARLLIKPEMKAETKSRLLNLFKDDIVQLQNLLNRDLSAWLQ